MPGIPHHDTREDITTSEQDILRKVQQQKRHLNEPADVVCNFPSSDRFLLSVAVAGARIRR